MAYGCPHCGKNSEILLNVIVVASRTGMFNLDGSFEVMDDGSPDFESSDIIGADEVKDPDLRKPKYHCDSCGKDFEEPKKVSG